MDSPRNNKSPDVESSRPWSVKPKRDEYLAPFRRKADDIAAFAFNLESSMSSPLTLNSLSSKRADDKSPGDGDGEDGPMLSKQLFPTDVSPFSESTDRNLNDKTFDVRSKVKTSIKKAFRALEDVRDLHRILFQCDANGVRETKTLYEYFINVV